MNPAQLCCSGYGGLLPSSNPPLGAAFDANPRLVDMRLAPHGKGLAEVLVVIVRHVLHLNARPLRISHVLFVGRSKRSVDSSLGLVS